MQYVIAFLITFSLNSYAVDLREYMPDGVVKLNNSNGTNHAKYTFTSSNVGLENVYNSYHNLGKAGTPYFWRKEYFQNSAWCTYTYGILFKGIDQSITETGDWYANTPCTPNVVLGYRTNSNANTGLIWSPAGGLTQTINYHESKVWNQGVPGGAYVNTGIDAYSKTGLIEELETFTPKYGRDFNGVWGEGNAKTYTDVVHMVMYHGTTSTPITRCNYSPLIAEGTYYQSFKNYNSYAIELWLAKGIGIIQERIPFVEKGSELGTTDCNGYVFNNTNWQWYIDEQ